MNRFILLRNGHAPYPNDPQHRPGLDTAHGLTVLTIAINGSPASHPDLCPSSQSVLEITFSFMKSLKRNASIYYLAFHQGNYNLPQPHYIVSGFGLKNQSFFNNSLGF
jgi:hypothetical protein